MTLLEHQFYFYFITWLSPFFSLPLPLPIFFYPQKVTNGPEGRGSGSWKERGKEGGEMRTSEIVSTEKIKKKVTSGIHWILLYFSISIYIIITCIHIFPHVYIIFWPLFVLKIEFHYNNSGTLSFLILQIYHRNPPWHLVLL